MTLINVQLSIILSVYYAIIIKNTIFFYHSLLNFASWLILLKQKKNILALFFEFINALLIIDVILTSLCLHFKKKKGKKIFFSYCMHPILVL